MVHLDERNEHISCATSIQNYRRQKQSRAKICSAVVRSRLSHGGVLRQTRMLVASRNESAWKAVASAVFRSRRSSNSHILI